MDGDGRGRPAGHGPWYAGGRLARLVMAGVMALGLAPPGGERALAQTPCFTQPTGSPIAVGNNPGSVAVGDFNADGFPDLAVANGCSNNVTILLGPCGPVPTQCSPRP